MQSVANLSAAPPEAGPQFEIIRAVDPEFVRFLDLAWPWSESPSDLRRALTINPIASVPGVLSGVMVCVEGSPAPFQLYIDFGQQQLRVLRYRRCLHRPRRAYPDVWRRVIDFLQKHGGLSNRPASHAIVA